MLVCECVSIRRVCVYCIASRNWHLLFNYLSLHNASHRLRTMIIIHMSLFEPRSSLSVHQSACLSANLGADWFFSLSNQKKLLYIFKKAFFSMEIALSQPASQADLLVGILSTIGQGQLWKLLLFSFSSCLLRPTRLTRLFFNFSITNVLKSTKKTWH